MTVQILKQNMSNPSNFSCIVQQEHYLLTQVTMNNFERHSEARKSEPCI